MKFAILSLAAAGALTFSAGSASAGPPGHHHGHSHGGYYGGGYSSFHPIGPHLGYHHGHSHYPDGFSRSGPVVPVYPSYSTPFYGGGFYSRPGFNITIGSGYSGPYYGGGYYGGRW